MIDRVQILSPYRGTLENSGELPIELIQGETLRVFVSFRYKSPGKEITIHLQGFIGVPGDPVASGESELSLTAAGDFVTRDTYLDIPIITSKLGTYNLFTRISEDPETYDEILNCVIITTLLNGDGNGEDNGEEDMVKMITAIMPIFLLMMLMMMMKPMMSKEEKVELPPGEEKL